MKQENNSDQFPKKQSFTLPPIPTFNIEPPVISQNSYTFYYEKKHLMLINGQSIYGSQKQQMQKKHKGKYDACQKTAAQNQSTGQAYINITQYGKCQKCGNWIIRTQLKTHDTFHAAIILENVFLGDKFSCQSKKELFQRLSVTHILNAATQINNYFEKDGIKYFQLDLMDNMSEDVIEPCLEAAKFISKMEIILENAVDEGGKVFVHCAMGKSRSVCAILMYMFQYLQIGIQEGLKLIKQKRSLAKPNPSYMEQLRKFQIQRKQVSKDNQEEQRRKGNNGFGPKLPFLYWISSTRLQQLLQQRLKTSLHMQKTITLKLNIFGNVHTFSCSEDFQIEALEQFCTLNNIKVDDTSIYAKVISFEQPYSSMVRKLQTVPVQ